jgi:hypothetical protein
MRRAILAAVAACMVAAAGAPAAHAAAQTTYDCTFVGVTGTTPGIGLLPGSAPFEFHGGANCHVLRDGVGFSMMGTVQSFGTFENVTCFSGLATDAVWSSGTSITFDDSQYDVWNVAYTAPLAAGTGPLAISEAGAYDYAIYRGAGTIAFDVAGDCSDPDGVQEFDVNGAFVLQGLPRR